MKTHYLLALLLHPLLAPAQAGPPVNMRAGQVVQLGAADVPVDVAVVNRSWYQRSPGFAVIAQGSNQLHLYNNNNFSPTLPPRFVLNSSYPVAPPQSLLPLLLPRTGPVGSAANIENLLVLGTNGALTRWSYTQLAVPPANPPQVYTPAGAPLPLRNGLPCAPTDRLVAGRYAPNSLGNDLVYWSDGPQPGFAQARHLGAGAYQAQPITTANGPTPGRGPVAVTASLNFFNGFTNDSEALFLPQPADTAVQVLVFQNQQRGGARTWWDFRYGRSLGPLGGPCLGMAVGQVDGPGTVLGALDCVFLNSGAIVLRYGRGTGTDNDIYTLHPTVPAETYPVLFVPREVRLADLTGDQRPEMLVLGDNGTLNIFENITLVPGSTTAFDPIPYVFATGPNPVILRLGDLDADGDLDVLVPCRGDRTVRLFMNDRRTLGTAPAAPASLALAVYPNPATAALTVRWAASGGGTAPAAATLLDALGRPVRAWPAVAPGTTLDVAGLARGVYALQVQGAAGRATRRVVLE